MNLEIERKFLVTAMPEPMSQYTCKHIEQGYLCTRPTVRIRSVKKQGKDGEQQQSYILTIKALPSGKQAGAQAETSPSQDAAHTPTSALINEETELALSEAAFLHLKEKIDGQYVKKTRYLIPLGNGLTAELDCFLEQLAGLVFVEVEFPDEAASNAFVPPAWFGTEVTQDKRYRNSYLSRLTRYEGFSQE